jgi:2,4-dienoyl-CoA reductase-like NADH-dependent reductase (Old Yellow Enzyme family)
MPTLSEVRTDALFRPFTVKDLTLANRIVMAPMTRSKSPRGIPGPEVAAYYRRRTEGGVGLIITEGTYVPHAGAGSYPDVPHFYGQESLAGWKRVVDAVHTAGGKIFPQLWHVGLVPAPGGSFLPGAVGPSGLAKTGEKVGEPMTQSDIDDVVRAFGEAAASAEALRFDGLEIHGAHGYLIDQFFWDVTNLWTDGYGGDLVARTRFAVEVIREVRRKRASDLSSSGAAGQTGGQYRSHQRRPSFAQRGFFLVGAGGPHVRRGVRQTRRPLRPYIGMARHCRSIMVA